jgi:hypothetical protein
MKKMMIVAAAVALTGVAFADTPCVIGPTPVVTNSAVYAWKFTGKTTVGALVSSKQVLNGASNCQLGSSTNIVCAIRVPGSLAIQGYVYYCDNCCDAFAQGTAGATVPTTQTFYMTKPFKDLFSVADITIDVAHIIGKTATQYETKGVATFNTIDPSEKYTLTFAGLGSFNKSLKVPSSVSGNFAGTLESPYYVARGVCVPADYWLCPALPSLVFAGAATDPSVAYGTWSVKYNASASRKYRANGTLIKLPAWTGLN